LPAATAPPPQRSEALKSAEKENRFLATEQTMLAGMRIEPGHRDRGILDEPPHCIAGEL